MAKKGTNVDSEINEVVDTIDTPIASPNETETLADGAPSEETQVQTEPIVATGEDVDSEQADRADSTDVDLETEGEGTGEQGVEIENTELSKREQTRNEIAQRVFARTNHGVLYFCSDNIPFATKSDAVNHSFSLFDKTVTPINR